MKKILFPTEFANHAPEVFKYAAELAYFFKAELMVMHAFGKPEYSLTTEELIEKRTAVVNENMVAFVQNHLPEDYRTDIKVSYLAKIGYPNEAIVKVAEENDVDIIVMGMTGKGQGIGNLFGQTSLDVLAKADCPVLTIPATAKFAGIDNIVYTTNFEFRDLEAINYLKKWSTTFEAPIHCMHVLEKEENMAIVQKNMTILKGAYRGQQDMHFDIVAGEFASETERFARAKKADIVAIMSHKRNFIFRLLERSAVKGITKNIQMPLLVLKDNTTKLSEDNETVLEYVYSIV